MSKPRSGAPKRVAVGLLASALAVFGIALAPQAGATSTVTTERLAGTTRYGTAQAIAVHSAMGAPTGAIVATGENFPDALAASTLSGANGPAPIVLTETNNYTAEAKAALAALKAKTPSVTAVTIVGGTAAVSSDVEASIKADGFTVTRTAGTTRYETAAAIATAANTKQTGGSGLVGGVKTAIFATGENFPDALAGGPMAFKNDLPLLLVTSTSVPQATQDAISTLKIKKAIILGGTTAISNDVQTQLSTLTGDTAPTRLAGSNRNATAAAIGDYEIGTLAFPATSAVLATGLNFPDALAAGPFAGVQGAPIVLTASLPAESSAFLDKYSYLITKLWVSGGTSAIDDATVTAAQTAAQTVSNDTSATDAPELIRVEAAGTSTSGTTTGGPIYRYVFDEPVQTSVTTGSFLAYTPYGEQVAATDAARDPSNTSAVLAAFTAANSTKVAEATVFTVASGAVQDPDGKVNPEGDLNGPATRTFAAGITRAPDLTTVAFVSRVGTTDTYDFTFDATISSVTTQGNFKMVYSNTTGVSEVAATTAALQTDTKVVRATFTQADGTFVGQRGVALANAVSGSTSTGGTAANYTEAADVSGQSGNTDAPDLVSITVDATGSTATFTFDEVVDTLGNAAVPATARASFHLYYRDGSAVADSTVATDRSSTDQRSIVAQFAAGAVNNKVAGGYVDAGTVVRPTVVGYSTASARANGDDEEGVASSFTAGAYNGPVLVSATRGTVTALGGAVTDYTVNYVFDQKVSMNADTSFKVVSASGTITAFTAGQCTVNTTVDSSSKTVQCKASNGSTNGTAISGARLATVAFDAVRGTAGNGASIGNHEERSPI